MRDHESCVFQSDTSINILKSTTSKQNSTYKRNFQQTRKKGRKSNVPRSSFITESNLSQGGEDTSWIFDTAATSHFCGNRSLLQNYLPVKGTTMSVAIGGVQCDIEGIGTVKMIFRNKDDLGIKAERTNAYSPQRNGVAERYNYTAVDGIKVLLNTSGLTKGFWAEALLCHSYVWNRVCHALRTPQADQWYKSMEEEIRVLKERKVWDLVPKPANGKVIGCRWVYTIKFNEKGVIVRYKARLVAQGFRQVQGIHYDEVFSPVVHFSIIRMCFSVLVCKQKWRHCQLDIKCAYLYATIQEGIFMTQPQGFVDPNKPDHVCHLNKALYGLHQSGREWFLEIHSVLENLNFKKLDWTNCVYAYQDNVVLLLYVDDIVIFAKTDILIEEVINRLSTHFDLKILGKTRTLLRVQLKKGDEFFIHLGIYP
ncbi:Retrovirus-related Pol polyprotein like [Argiope bruennichi]|uniref:Retrovirus-related Pol polyprotein like n=1 Tax=Argiope bruennichi TaxID=94029 RepID=A0A8T0FZ22_ARGBR|nr:Retrovirus-related Pol polyprotein like [Argiope bruennichi]